MFQAMKKLSFQASRNLISILMCIGVGSALTSFKAFASPKNLQGYVMHVQMTPAACAMDKTKLKQRKCLEGYSLTIMGLIPETTQRDCSTQSSAKLSPIQAQVVARVMPDENARARLWQEVGGCVPLNASQYFRDIINKAQNLKIPSNLTGVENKLVQKNVLISQFYRLNPKLQKDSIRLNCHNGSNNSSVLTSIQVCYKVNGQYKQCTNPEAANCPSTFMIKGSY